MNGTDSKGIREESLERWPLNLGVRPAYRERAIFPSEREEGESEAVTKARIPGGIWISSFLREGTLTVSEQSNDPISVPRCC